MFSMCLAQWPLCEFNVNSSDEGGGACGRAGIFNNGNTPAVTSATLHIMRRAASRQVSNIVARQGNVLLTAIPRRRRRSNLQRQLLRGPLCIGEEGCPATILVMAAFCLRWSPTASRHIVRGVSDHRGDVWLGGIQKSPRNVQQKNCHRSKSRHKSGCWVRASLFAPA